MKRWSKISGVKRKCSFQEEQERWMPARRKSYHAASLLCLKGDEGRERRKEKKKKKKTGWLFFSGDGEGGTETYGVNEGLNIN